MFDFYLGEPFKEIGRNLLIYEVSIVVRPNDRFRETYETRYCIPIHDMIDGNFRREIERMAHRVARQMIDHMNLLPEDEYYIRSCFIEEFANYLEQQGMVYNTYERSPISILNRDDYYRHVIGNFVEKKKEQPSDKFKEMGRTPLVKEILTETEQASKEYVKDKLKEAIASIK
jgi:hypothetical protein